MSDISWDNMFLFRTLINLPETVCPLDLHPNLNLTSDPFLSGIELSAIQHTNSEINTKLPLPIHKNTSSNIDTKPKENHKAVKYPHMICAYESCYRYAAYAFLRKQYTSNNELSDERYCSRHKKPGMTNYKNDLCTIDPDCKKKAKYHYYAKNSYVIRTCKKHKCGPVYEKGLKCVSYLCSLRPIYYTDKCIDKKPILCQKHSINFSNINVDDREKYGLHDNEMLCHPKIPIADFRDLYYDPYIIL